MKNKISSYQRGEIEGAKHSVHGCQPLRVIHCNEDNPVLFHDNRGADAGEISEGGQSDDDSRDKVDRCLFAAEQIVEPFRDVKVCREKEAVEDDQDVLKGKAMQSSHDIGYHSVSHYLHHKERLGRGEPLASVNPVSDQGTEDDDCETFGETIDAHQLQVITLETHQKQSAAKVPHPVAPSGQRTGHVHLVRDPKLGCLYFFFLDHRCTLF